MTRNTCTGTCTAALVALLLLLPAPAQAQPACGDCNLDSTVSSIIDALVGAQISASVMTPSAAQVCSCDVNNDGSVTIIDALIMAQFAAQLPVSLNCPAACGQGNQPPTCSITQPAGTQAGDVILTFDTVDADNDPLNLTFEVSTDSGNTYFQATSSGSGSVATNPANGTPPAPGQTFGWDSVTDNVGTGGSVPVVFRLTATDTLNPPATCTASFSVDNSGPPPPGCTVVTCGGSSPGSTGPGTQQFPVATFNFDPNSGDSMAFVADVSGRNPGDAVNITVSNISDDVDLWIIDPPGPQCGETSGAFYRISDSGGVIGLGDESEDLSDAEATAYGNMIPFAVYHFDPAPTATFTVTVTCTPPPPPGNCTTVTCGGSSPGTTGPGTQQYPVATFNFDPNSGDSMAFVADVTGRNPGDLVNITVSGITDDVDLWIIDPPGPQCGETSGAFYRISDSGGVIGLGDETEDLTDAEATAYGNMIPFAVYHFDPAPTASFTVTVTCTPPPPPGNCTTVTCGTTTPGSTGPGTQQYPVATLNFDPNNGDSMGFEADVSARAPGESLLITITNISDDVDLWIIDPAGPPCGETNGAMYRISDSGGVIGLGDETEAMTDAELTARSNLVQFAVYHYDPAPTATFDVVITCLPACTAPSGGSGTCASPYVIPPAAGTCYDGNTSGAPNNVSGAACGDGGTGPEHVYSWTPSGNGTATASLCGSAYDTILYVRQTTCNGTELACNDDSCGLQSQLTFPYTAGTTYYIIVDGYGGDFGDYTLTVTP